MSKNSPARLLAEKKAQTRQKRNTSAVGDTVLWTNRLIELREGLNLSMRDVAGAVGISVAAYFRIEKGYADVSLSNAMGLASFFDMPVEVIWLKFDAKS